MSPGEELEAVLGSLARAGFDAAEVYAKKGRSRRYSLSIGDGVVSFAEEAGWAVRGGAGGTSFFLAGTGPPLQEASWPEPGPGPLALPEPLPIPPFAESRGLESPLLAEREGLALLEALGRELAAELPGSRLLTARLEDGASESRIRNSRGVEAAWRNRLAALELEAVGPSGAPASLGLAAAEARELAPAAVARRLADRLTVAAGRSPERDRGEFLLAPLVAARILAGLAPLFVGAQAAVHARRLGDRAGRLGSDALTVVDDGRHPGGPLATAVDGEGLPTRRLTLIEAGRFRRALGQRTEGSAGAGGGWMRRPGWREPPRPGPSHLYLAPDAEVSVASLLAGVARGYYLVDAPSPGFFDLVGDLFTLPVRGFAISGGKALFPVAKGQLTGAISALLRGLKARARDLAFLPLDGLFGSPTVLATGIEIAGEDG